MKVVILAGAGGARLLPLTQITPKPLLPVANTPLALHLVQHLKRCGFTDLIFCISKDQTALMEVLGNGDPWDMVIRYVVEDRPSGTAGALGQLAPLLSNDTFLVMGCNVLFNFNLRDLVKQHVRSRAEATVLVSKLPAAYDSGRHEIVEVNEDGSIGRVHRGETARTDFRFFPVGVYCFQPSVFDFFRKGESFLDIKEQLLQRMMENGRPVIAHQLPGEWQYLFTLEDYLKLNDTVLAGQLGSISYQHQISPNVWIGQNVRLGNRVNLIPPVVIGDNTIIDDDVQIVGGTVIGADCFVGKGSVLRECAVWNRCRIAEGNWIERTVITRDGVVGPRQRLQGAVVVKEQLRPAAVNLLAKNYNITTIASSAATTVLPGPQRRRLFDFSKRVMDIVLSLLLVILLAPVMLLVALAIKFDSPGPVFFRQRRAGLGGREFWMMKFRSMVQDAAHRQDQLRHLNQVDGPIFKIENDPRMTRVGKILRKLSLDEFPQLFNIMRGEMSFVGPRPLAYKELKYEPSWSETRLQVKPGLTGLWQVSGRSDSSFRDWVAMDKYYAMHQSLLLDLKILFKTPFNVLLGSGAY
ncbi:MAG: Bifunctional protein GlmU [bacterium]|nr:Bifunctional protein GlmU [bacterium]MCK6560978.1 sugar transferase [bacterium]NUM64779.1 sugar transferase [candidate division KSB1 bacterium]